GSILIAPSRNDAAAPSRSSSARCTPTALARSLERACVVNRMLIRSLTAMRILVADKLADEGLEFLKQNRAEFDVKVGLKEDDLAAEVGSGRYDALIVRSGAK